MSNPFNNLLFSYTEHLKILNRSKTTITNYIWALKKFFTYLQNNGITRLNRITSGTIKNYRSHLAEDKDKTGKPRYSGSTVSRFISQLKTWFDYLEQTSQILINPAEYIKLPNKAAALPGVILTAPEMEKLLNQPNLSTRKGIRDKTVFEVLYSTGIRLDELCGLTIYDADLKQGLLRVKGKGAKDRVVPMGKHAVRLLKEYLKQIRPYYTKPKKKYKRKKGIIQTNILFVGIKGYPIDRHQIQRFIKKHCNSARIRKNVTAHSFRHTFATHMLKNGADIRTVQLLLGHASLNTTQIYLKTTGIEIKQTHKNHHPAEKEKITKKEIYPKINRIKEEYRSRV